MLYNNINIHVQSGMTALTGWISTTNSTAGQRKILATREIRAILKMYSKQ